MKKLLTAMALMTLFLAAPLKAQAQNPVGFGMLYYEGTVVGTVVPPASSPMEGRENFYAVPGQLAVIATAPGDKDYRGGKWAFHSVVFTGDADPIELTSETDVLQAAMDGDIMITRVPSMDFKCPVQP